MKSKKINATKKKHQNFLYYMKDYFESLIEMLAKRFPNNADIKSLFL